MKTIIYSGNIREHNKKMIETIFHDYTWVSSHAAKEMNFCNSRVVLVSKINALGIDGDMFSFLEKVLEKQSFENATVGAFVESDTELHTRDAGVQYLYIANKAGANLPGKALVEAIIGEENFVPLSGPLGLEPTKILDGQLKNLHNRMEAEIKRAEKPILSVWTIGRPGISATRELWERIEPHLQGIEIDLLSFGDENIRDCRGCAYAICKEKGQQTSCIYEDYVVEKIYPSIEKSDSILLLTPNYNDMMPANFVSAINRLTALFRKRKFYDKKIFAAIVAGHTGQERLSQQIIGALNINKTFYVPKRFSLEVRAHNADAVRENAEIGKKARAFGKHVRSELLG